MTKDVRTGPTPLLDERRLIDGVYHAWCGVGWVAECYAQYVSFPIQLPKELKP